MQQGMWKGRFQQDMNAKVLAYSQSLDLDWRLLPWDVAGSRAHAKGLAKIGVLTAEEAEKLCAGLDQIVAEYKSGALVGKEALEDVHMNVEARLTEIVGPLGGKLHTGRSRNDQVATTMRLYLRDVVKDLKLYTEYRLVGRVIDPILYRTQPFNVDLDPVHLDTLDYALLSQSRSLRLKVCLQTDSTWRIDGTVIRGDKEGETFAYRAHHLLLSHPSGCAQIARPLQSENRCFSFEKLSPAFRKREQLF